MRAALSKLLTQQTNGAPATRFLLHFSNFQPFFALKFWGGKKREKKGRKKEAKVCVSTIQRCIPVAS